MEAPKLRGMFRNVRTKPRSFVFKSGHLSESRPDWDERKRRIESEMIKNQGEKVDDGSKQANISFRKGGGSVLDRSTKSDSVKHAARKANFRALMIAGILIWITWKMIVWAEKTEFGKMLEFIRDNG